MKSHILFFLYNNKSLHDQTNIFDFVEYNNLDDNLQEIYNNNKKRRNINKKYSEGITEKRKNKNIEIIYTEYINININSIIMILL